MGASKSKSHNSAQAHPDGSDPTRGQDNKNLPVVATKTSGNASDITKRVAPDRPQYSSQSPFVELPEKMIKAGYWFGHD